MHHARGQAGQAAQAGAVVQIAQQRRDALRAQRRQAFGRRREGDQLEPRRQLAGNAQADIAAADDQNALTAKARWQRTKGV